MNIETTAEVFSWLDSATLIDIQLMASFARPAMGATAEEFSKAVQKAQELKQIQRFKGYEEQDINQIGI